MKLDPFAASLVHKSEQSIRSAHLTLQAGDPDTAVNRAYYAMFNIARAALLSAGVPEGDLPRFVRSVQKEFGLETPDKHATAEKDSSQKLE